MYGLPTIPAMMHRHDRLRLCRNHRPALLRRCVFRCVFLSAAIITAASASQTASATGQAKPAPKPAHKPAPQALRTAATQFLRAQASAIGLPGQPRITITLPKRAEKLPACTALTPFLANTSALRPRMSVGLRCTAPAAWTVYAQAAISIPGRYYVAARTLAPGQPLKASDLTPRDGDLLALPRSAVTNPDAVTGWRTDQRIASGQIIRTDTLRAAATITRGQTVTLHAHGAGFVVHHTGQALAAGAPGQKIPVRTASGHTVTAVVRDGGSVEVGL